jgi:hypothetical protein
MSFFFFRDQFNRKYEFQRAYGRLRFVCNEIEKTELDSHEGRHIFGMSTAVGLMFIGAYAILVVFALPNLNHQSINCMHSLVGKQY